MTSRMRRWRLRLAQTIAPHCADVHNPDESACPNDRVVLEAAEAWDLSPDADGRVRLDVTAVVDDMAAARWISLTSDHEDSPIYQIESAGKRALRRVDVLSARRATVYGPWRRLTALVDRLARMRGWS